ncbi:MAG: hypothetical protein ACK2T4_07165 [Candidatus Promineifilaceae bacterium]
MKDRTPADGRHRMLAEGQALLLTMREEMRLARERSEEAPSFSDPAAGDQLSVISNQSSVHRSLVTGHGSPVTGHRSLDTDQLVKIVAGLPDHLGWGSAAQTAVLRAAARRHLEQPQKDNGEALSFVKPRRTCNSKTDFQEEPQFSADGSISIAPSLGLAILRHKQAAPARLWLLLRAVDSRGRGMIPLETARKAFTDQDSGLRFCGWRQLRNLLAAGADTFWQVDEDHIWLRSAARVAAAFKVTHFSGKDVALPVSELTGGIAAVRAHLYATFHSGRQAKPVSRQTLAGKSGVAPRTQRHYDRLIGVEKQTNYVRGSRVGSEEGVDQAWQQGSAAFTWQETRRGKKEPNGRFLAWQLPNSYHGPHAQLGRGRQKRQNKALADLLNKGTAGNCQSQRDDLQPRYFADARVAAQAFGRSKAPIYWPDLKPGLWHCVWPQKPANHQNQPTELSK